MHGVFISLMLVCTLIISGCQSRHLSVKSEKMNFSNAYSSCTGNQSLPSKVSPAQWYENMLQCAAKGNFQGAAMSYLFAGTYSWYDSRMINTHYSRSLHSMLPRQALEKLTPVQQERLWDTLESLMKLERNKQAVCQIIAETGGPDYRPDYMLKNSIRFGIMDMDKNTIFDDALQGYLHCLL